jgi:Winged helix-turn helix
VSPPFDPLASLSRLMRNGAEPGLTRDDHLEISAQMYAIAARARQAADLAEIVGEDALSAGEPDYLRARAVFESEFLPCQLLSGSACACAVLESLARSYTLPYWQVTRAQMVLMAAEGLRNDQIAAGLRCGRDVVSQWRKRFFEQRLAGLEDRPRRGRPPTFPPSRPR